MPCIGRGTQLSQGLGESISRVLTKNDPVPQEFVATNIGESGSPSKLMDKYGLNSKAIISAVEKVLSRKWKKITHYFFYFF